MSKVLGIIDALEAAVLEGKKVPFSNNVILSEERLFDLIDKLRTVVKLGMVSDFSTEKTETQIDVGPVRNDLDDVIEKSEKIRQGADDYADYVLTNLQLSVTKMRKSLIRLESNIENGREVLDERKKSIKENSIEKQG